MSDTKYDASILQQYADDLYTQASWVIVRMALIYGLVTFAAFSIFANSNALFRSNVKFTIQPGVLLFAVIGALVGAGVGRTKAFKLKLEAQTLLCQRQIEVNTRTAAKPELTSAATGR
jgi:uncharacterized membrane protein